MKPFDEIAQSASGSAVITAAVILLYVQITLLVFALSLRRKSLLAVGCAATTVLGAVLMTFLLDGIYTLDYLPYRREYGAVTESLYALPWIVPLLTEVALTIFSVYAAVSLIRIRRTKVSPYSVKEAVDHLPVGICIADPRTGSVLLSNLKMNEVFTLMAKHPLTNAEELSGLFATDDSGLYKHGENAYRLSRWELKADGKSYTETTLEDQTEQYRKTRELEEKNARLIDLQVRLKAYRVRNEDLLIKRELLEARKTIHSELGAALLTGKYWFEHPENVEGKELLSMMRQINTYLLAEAEEPEDRRDEYAAALKIAERIGVRVSESGEAPLEEPFRSVIGLALGECAANAVKHAGGDRVTVLFTQNGNRREAVITNNGIPPEKEIKEVGGLLSVRMAAKEAGMEMILQSAPTFSLTLRFSSDS